jgi:hypothetical protein
MKQATVLEEKSYTFRDYFQLNVRAKDLLAHFGYGFAVQDYPLPRTRQELSRAEELAAYLKQGLPHINLSNEFARQQFLIAPVLFEVAQYTQAEITVEYPLTVNDQLKGVLDYYIEVNQPAPHYKLLVIEAKDADLQRGFTQLAVELVALDLWLEEAPALLYGAVSTGNSWQFGLLNRPEKRVIQDLNVYGIPPNLEEVLRILIGILTDETGNSG